MIVEDENNLPELIDKLNRLKGSSVEVGILGGGEVLIYANVHEFGAPSIGVPERSFMRSTIDNKENEILDAVEDAIWRYLEGEITLRNALTMIGEYLVGEVKKTIKDMDSPPLKPETITAKGSSGVLVDTGRLINSIDYKVVEG